MRKLALFLLVTLLVSTQAIMAQNKAISGTVVDEYGEPLPGVAIVVKGTSIGTTSNFDGAYSLQVPTNAEILTFSFIGMSTQEVTLGSQSVVNVTMKSDTEDIDEIVVTGYGVRKKELSTSAVAVLGGDDLETMAPSTSVDNMLQGKAAGVDAVSLNGKPGATATVKVRGAISLNTMGGDKSQPTYVVDGVYVDADAMGMINPSDIASMTVLKDAASAALYGSRGANGVVVVTTKKGKQGDAKINYTGRFGVTQKIDDPYDMMNAAEKIEYEEAVYGELYTDAEKAQMIAQDHNWQDDILKSGKTESHALTMSGGTEASNYFISLGYDKNTGIIERLDGFERTSARVNTSSKVKKWLEVGTGVAISHSKSQESRDRYNAQNPFYAMYSYNPYIPVYQKDAEGNAVIDDNGNKIYDIPNGGLSILEALENNPETQYNTRLLGNIYGKFTLAEGLTYTSKYAGNYNRYKREYYVQPGSVLDGYVGDASAPGSKTDNGRDTYEYNWLNQISFARVFNQVHNLNASVFTEYNEGSWHSYSLSSKGYPSGDLDTQDNSAEATAATTSREEWAMFSMAALADYSYAEKYLVSASIRRDGASRFGADTRYGTFYSFSAGWNIYKESFMENVSFVDRLKIVASYGTLGNWDIPNYGSQGYYNFGKYNGQSAAVPTPRVSNEALTWEKQKSFNFGLEAGLLNNRLNITADYFINTRTDFLFEVPKSYEGGSYTQYQNAGEMRTNGFELSLSGDIIKSADFRWNVSANITFIGYDVKQLDQEQIIIDGDNILKEGEEPFTFYLVRSAGVDTQNGDALYYDVNGNVTNVYSSGDKVVLKDKSPLAKSFGGFSTYLNYKGIDLSADFSFRLGNYIYNQMTFDMLSDGENAASNQRKEALDYWKKPGDSKLPRLNGNSNQSSDRFLEDGSYLRFRSLTLGYTLPNSLVSKVGIGKVRVFVQGQNLLTWTKFEGDPEVSVGSGENQLGSTQNFIPGAFALYSYPAVRTFMGGVNISF